MYQKHYQMLNFVHILLTETLVIGEKAALTVLRNTCQRATIVLKIPYHSVFIEGMSENSLIQMHLGIFRLGPRIVIAQCCTINNTR